MAKEKVAKPAKTPSKVELVSYTIRAVISTGQYSNIQPEITVLANTLEEAKAYVLPHVDELFKVYLNRGDRPVYFVGGTAAKAEPIVTTANVIDPPKGNGKPEPETKAETVKEPAKSTGPSEPFKKAFQAVTSCLSAEALAVIKGQIEKSVKLNDKEKTELAEVVRVKNDSYNSL